MTTLALLLWLAQAPTAVAVDPTVRVEPARVTAPMTVEVDAREAPRRLLRARIHVPTTGPTLDLGYPKWLPGEHGPTGPINDVVRVAMSAGGKPVPWRRDPSDAWLFHVDVPAGARGVDVELEFATGAGGRGTISEAVSSSQLVLVKWNHLVLYPLGRPVRQVQVAASLRVPAGWKLATSLPVRKRSGDGATFETVSLETLVDSPVHAGAFARSIDLGTHDGRAHALHVVGEGPEAIEFSASRVEGTRRLVVEAGALFRARPYRKYDFLLAFSDLVPHGGLEHHESSDNRLPERAWLDDVPFAVRGASLLPHELVHSWNGKHRRPAGLIADDYQRPVDTGLLWVYEGLTSYLGEVLTARSGLRTVRQEQEVIAGYAALMAGRTGRAWRSVGDTAASASILGRSPREWRTSRRGVDYYTEALFIWLEADALIRERSGGTKSLDDVCRAFFGGWQTPEVVPYTFEDLTTALAVVVAHDWEGFFRERVHGLATATPARALAAAGWQLVFREEPSEIVRRLDEANKEIELSSSIGLLLRDDGTIIDVVPDSPAARAGLGPTMKLVAVEGRRFTPDRIRTAVRATKTRPGISVIVENGDYVTPRKLEYRGGHRYPALAPLDGKPDRLSAILAPLRP